ncbi:hypothetical protein, partial [Klebsiella pneumoniae]|uniref:hypothetical protein n=1 Tax=Klebsiella pneumoniae TaxID=573 RepID=UPI002731E5DF
TLKLASLLHLGFFSVFGSVLVVALALMWLIVAKRTVQHRLHHGQLVEVGVEQVLHDAVQVRVQFCLLGVPGYGSRRSSSA